MPRIPHLRVIIEAEPNAGDWNMAVDEALLQSAIERDVATLRWYQWSAPTVSLGYFQKLSELGEDSELSKLAVVRRLSGGGAIVHDDEFTYSISLPASQRLFSQPHELYDIIHECIVRGLRQLDIPAELRGTTSKRPDEPLLCFQRKDSHDVVLGGQKILGSAQRRRRGAIIQHGSLIRRSSTIVRQIVGVMDLCDAVLPSNFAHRLSGLIADEIADSNSLDRLSEAEFDTARTFCEEAAKNVLTR